MPDPATGDVLTRDNALSPPIKWAPPAGAGKAPTIFAPVGLHPVDEAVCDLLSVSIKTVEVDEESRAVYLGRAQDAFTGAEAVLDIQTAVDKADWCEVAICKGTPVLCNGPSSLTRIAAVDTATLFETPGPLSVDFGTVAIEAGDDLWLVWGCKIIAGGTLPAFRAMQADGLMSGVFVYASGTRPSTMTAGTSFNRPGSTERAAQCLLGCS